MYLAIALSGLCALAAEVIWTRILSLMLGATVYTFSLILAVILLGLGIGSSIGAILSRRNDPRLVLGACQLLLTAAIAWTAFIVADSLPYWPIDPSLAASPWSHFQLDAVRCIWAVLPAALLWGASFPAAIAAVAQQGKDLGRLVGGVYASNTVGAILGALAFSILLIPRFGTQNSQRILIVLSALASLLALAPSLRQWWTSAPPARVSVAALLLICLSAASLFTWSVPAIPWELIAYGRYLPSKHDQASLVFVGEGMNSSVAVTRFASGNRMFHVSGKVEASSEPQDMRLQRMLGHIPALIHHDPRSVLVVGCGAGVTAGSFVVHPELERLVICEIEPLIPQVVATHFGFENYFVLKDPRVQVVYDDARHYVLTTSDTFDIITSDPIHPWVKGAATLYTKEYFELCKRHLKPGGVVAQWVPLYESSTETVKSEIRTFLEVFPEATIWSNDAGGKGYDIVLLGQADPTHIPVDLLQLRLDRDDHAAVAESLREAGFESLPQLLATFAGAGRDLEPWLRDAQVNRDNNLRLQYLAGLGLNSYRSEEIFDDMMHYYRIPPDLFLTTKISAQPLNEELAKSALRRIRQ